MSSGSATIQDVARQAGVSVTTVSRALRGTGPVSSATNEKILAVAESLRFVATRGRRVGKRCANGIVFTGRRCPEIVTGYERVSVANGRSVRILETGGGPSAELAVRQLAAQVDGLVLFGSAVPDSLVAELVDQGLPVVAVARPPLLGVDVVDVDTTAPGKAMARHLIGHGYSRFAFVGTGSAAVRADLERVSRKVIQVVCRPDAESARQVGLRLLRAEARPDALLCGNDEIAVGLLLAAEELGLLVPGDVAVTGWGGVASTGSAHPALTTVRYRPREVGATAARVLHERISGQRIAPRRVVLDGALVLRTSCGFHTR